VAAQLESSYPVANTRYSNCEGAAIWQISTLMMETDEISEILAFSTTFTLLIDPPSVI
jgi:hypothetical protein